MEVQQTTNYGQFKLILSNRELIPGHVQKLKESVLKRNLLEENPIVVTPDLRVIDGQHRLEVAKELGINIFYIVSDKMSDDDISHLNTTKRNWKLEDYLHYYTTKGIEHYKTVSSFINHNTQIPLSGALYLLAIEHKGLMNDFREGKFEVQNKAESETVVNQLKELSQYGKHVYSLIFIRRFSEISRSKKFDFKKFIYQIQKAPRTFVPCITAKQYTELLEEIYNRDVPGKNHVSLKD